jgi:hypothetical protein
MFSILHSEFKGFQFIKDITSIYIYIVYLCSGIPNDDNDIKPATVIL